MSSGMAGSGGDFFKTLQCPQRAISGVYAATLALAPGAQLEIGQDVEVRLVRDLGVFGPIELLEVGYRPVTAKLVGSADETAVMGPIVFGPDVGIWRRPVAVALYASRRLIACGEPRLVQPIPGSGLISFAGLALG